MGHVRARSGGDGQALAVDHGHPNCDDERVRIGISNFASEGGLGESFMAELLS